MKQLLLAAILLSFTACEGYPKIESEPAPKTGQLTLEEEQSITFTKAKSPILQCPICGDRNSTQPKPFKRWTFVYHLCANGHTLRTSCNLTTEPFVCVGTLEKE